MIDIPFAKLHIKKQYRTDLKNKAVKAIGYDTETVNGLCVLLASPTEYVHPKTFDTILEFLTTDRRRGKIGFFYNLKYDFQAILKWLPVEFWDEIHRKGQTRYGDFELIYIPKKMFRIRRLTAKTSRVFSFYDIAQFYKGMSLDAASKTYLGKKKLDTGLNLGELTIEECHTEPIIRYCKNDAKLCEELAEVFIKTCHKQELFPTSFCSPATISARFFQSRAEIPTINRVPKHFLHMAWLAYSGAFITIFKKGYFKKVFEYDINSAYPYAMTQLPNLDDGVFSFVKGNVPEDAELGWLKVRVMIDESDPGYYHPPFVMIRPPLPNYMPCGSFETYVTLAEYEAYQEDVIIEPICGLYWKGTKLNVRYPFLDVVEYLYKTRKSIKDPASNYFLKICLNGFYGKNFQKIIDRDEDSKTFGKLNTGNFFNPFYASYITALCRVMVFEALKKCPVEAQIGCFTDSILTTIPLTMPLSDRLGDWQFSQAGELLMVGCGVYTFRGDKGLKTKARGFHTTSKIDLFEIFRAHPDVVTVPISVMTNISFSQAMIQKKPQDMNLLVKNERLININFDIKRMWEGRFDCTQDALEKNIDSLPIPYYDYIERG